METKLAYLRKDTQSSSHRYSSVCQGSSACPGSLQSPHRGVGPATAQNPLLRGTPSLVWPLLLAPSPLCQQQSAAHPFPQALGQMFSGLRGWVLDEECGGFEGLREPALEGQHLLSSA